MANASEGKLDLSTFPVIDTDNNIVRLNASFIMEDATFIENITGHQEELKQTISQNLFILVLAKHELNEIVQVSKEYNGQLTLLWGKSKNKRIRSIFKSLAKQDKNTRHFVPITSSKHPDTTKRKHDAICLYRKCSASRHG
eukprot:781990_1